MILQMIDQTGDRTLRPKQEIIWHRRTFISIFLFSVVHQFLYTSAGRLFLLLLLVLNLASCTLLQRYTLVDSGSTYLPTVAVFAAEVQKLIIAIIVSVSWEHRGQMTVGCGEIGFLGFSKMCTECDWVMELKELTRQLKISTEVRESNYIKTQKQID